VPPSLKFVRIVNRLVVLIYNHNLKASLAINFNRLVCTFSNCLFKYYIDLKIVYKYSNEISRTLVFKLVAIHTENSK
jgi:hypothetical protein